MGTQVRSDLLGGRYRLEQRIGSGGMAGVHLARDERLGRDVAVKLTDPGADAKSSARIEQEARRVARLNHPNVVQVHDVGTTSDDAYIVMELVQGRGLDAMIREEGPLPADEAVRIALQVCDGLAAAHTAGIVHLDIKPSNVLVDGTGRVRIADFGVARGHGGDTVTEEEPFGSAPYVSPEQVTGEHVDQRSDLYSLGVVLYEMLTGRRPFAGDTVAATVLQRVNREPEPPGRWVELSPGLEAVVMQALSRAPDRRFADADAMAAALRSAAGAEGSASRRDRTAPIPVTPARGGRVREASFALFALAGLLVAWAIFALPGTTATQPDVTVPDVSGMTVAAASRVLADHDLEVGGITSTRGGGAVPGTVLGQAPAPGTRIEEGSTVDLVVADEPRAPTAPTSPAAEDGRRGATGDRSDAVSPEPEPEAGSRDEPEVERGPAGKSPPGHGGTPPGQGGVPPGRSGP